jgi:hypothetical protein
LEVMMASEFNQLCWDQQVIQHVIISLKTSRQLKP